MSAKDNADYLMQRAMSAGITDKNELAHFMGQMQVESSGFTSMNEDLNYSGPRLLHVFHGRNGLDSLSEANKIAANGSQAVGDAVYGGEWGRVTLGNTNPGDGYNFHGRGYVQLTGRERYTEAANITGLDLVNHPDLAADRTNAATIAVDYWQKFVVPHNAQDNVKQATYYINGGYNGLSDREKAVAEWERKLEHGYVPGTHEPATSHGPTVPRNLSEGMHGDDVRKLQTQLGELGYLPDTGTPDGKFGPATRDAVKAFQRDHHLTDNGKAGRATETALEADLKPLKQDDPDLLPSVASMSGLPAATPGVDDPRNPLNRNHALYNNIKEYFPDASDNRALEFTASCYSHGINAKNLDAVHYDQKNGIVSFGAVNDLVAKVANVDVKMPSPQPEQSIQQIQQYDQTQAQIAAMCQAQSQAQAQQGPMPGGR